MSSFCILLGLLSLSFVAFFYGMFSATRFVTIFFIGWSTVAWFTIFDSMQLSSRPADHVLLVYTLDLTRCDQYEVFYDYAIFPFFQKNLVSVPDSDADA